MQTRPKTKVVEDSYMTPAIETRALRKCYGELTALDALDLRIAPGEIYCLLGANGAGKTHHDQPPARLCFANQR